MQRHLLIILFLLKFFDGLSQEIDIKEYSYTEFFQLIEKETDTVFYLNDAVIIYNPATDNRFKSRVTLEGDNLYNRNEEIIIDKKIVLNNIKFLVNVFNDDSVGWMEGVLRDVHFKKDVELNEVISFNAEHCKFSGGFNYELLDCDLDNLQVYGRTYHSYRNCSFQNFSVFKNCERFTSGTRGYFLLRNNTFISSDETTSFSIMIFGSESSQISNNYIQSNGLVYLYLKEVGGGLQFEKNTIKSEYSTINIEDILSELNISKNNFSSFLRLGIDQLKSNDNVEWNQFNGKLLSVSSHANYVTDETNYIFDRINSTKRKELHKTYIDSVRYNNKNAFVSEIALKGRFYDYYKSRYDTETANDVYLELKDFETARMKVLYEQSPSFKTYFTWKINQFLKIFSAYGTQPARAIIFSLYVIIFFAIIYLFFPNNWDSHGKNRIVNRYNFFFKYMKRKAGIHEVYLEDQKEALMSYDQFKRNISNSEQKVPKFFIVTALPLYKWAISGTKISTSLLKRIDILKGSWNSLPSNKRVGKSILLIGAFLIAIMYDLIIKMLNALMLSINTFTTLGFGEIPIKGLPRYLAIIQGFVGWFMLTIFSVSLISQLLN